MGCNLEGDRRVEEEGEEAVPVYGSISDVPPLRVHLCYLLLLAVWKMERGGHTLHKNCETCIANKKYFFES